MYREVVRLKPIIHQVIHFSALIRAWEIANDTRIEMGQYVSEENGSHAIRDHQYECNNLLEPYMKLLISLTREELALILTVFRIGSSERGYHYESPETGPALIMVNRYDIPIHATSEELLLRYSKYFRYHTRERMIEFLSRHGEVSEQLSEGLLVLDQHADPQGEDSVLVEIIVARHIITYIDVPKCVGENIKALSGEFLDFLQNITGNHPFRQHNECIEFGELSYKGYINVYGAEDFIDWLNVDRYGSEVAKIVEVTEETPLFTIYF